MRLAATSSAAVDLAELEVEVVEAVDHTASAYSHFHPDLALLAAAHDTALAYTSSDQATMTTKLRSH